MEIVDVPALKEAAQYCIALLERATGALAQRPSNIKDAGMHLREIEQKSGELSPPPQEEFTSLDREVDGDSSCFVIAAMKAILLRFVHTADVLAQRGPMLALDAATTFRRVGQISRFLLQSPYFGGNSGSASSETGRFIK